jgi:virginiamycin B lyase
MIAQRALLIAAVAIAFAGCSNSGGSGVPGVLSLPGQTVTLPEVSQKGKGAQWVQFLPKTLGASYSAIVPGPDGNMWFIDETGGGLVRMSLSGATKEFRLSSVLQGNAVSLAVGADGKFYILDESSNVVVVTKAGTAVSIPIPSGDNTSIDGLAPGPDGNVWFAEFNHYAKITPSGKITEFPYPSGYSTNQYGGVTTGSDGNVWLAESSNNAIGRIVPSTGAITMFTDPVECEPAPLVLGNDGNVWFACLANEPSIGSVTPSGGFANYPIGGSFNFNETEQFCERGPDGEPWCASANDNTVFRIDTTAHTVTTYTPPLGSESRPDAVAAGPDGNVWLDTAGAPGDIDVLIPNPLKVKPNKLAFGATGQMQNLMVTEQGTSSWTARSSDTAVATVGAGGSNATFTVRSVGAGSCKITISDGAGNSVAVKVTVS